MASKKELQRLVDKYHERNEELQDEIRCLREELQRLTEDFVRSYNYVILNKDYKTEIYKDGIKLDRITFISIEQDAGEIPEITMEMR